MKLKIKETGLLEIIKKINILNIEILFIFKMLTDFHKG